MLDDQSVTRRFLHDPSSAVKMVTKDLSSGLPLHDHALKADKLEYGTSQLIQSETEREPEPEVMRYYVLDRVRFPNGSAYFNAKLPTRLGITPYIVHNNCIIGKSSTPSTLRSSFSYLLKACEDTILR